MWQVVSWVLRFFGFARVRNGAIITDCYDTSARGRLTTRWRALFGWTPTFVDIMAETSELENGSAQAMVHLLNQIDASRSPEPLSWWRRWRRGDVVILINSATRGQKPVQRPNGSPFAYWWVDRFTLVVATLDGPVLPLANHYGVVPDGVVWEVDLDAVMTHAVECGWIRAAEADRIRGTQFRSLEYQILVAKWLSEGKHLPEIEHQLPSVNDHAVRALYADNFGNVTLDITPEEFGYVPGATITLANGSVAVCYPQLKDVPNRQTGITIGSDGYRDPTTGKEVRFLELVIQRGRAADVHEFTLGDMVVSADHVPARRRQTSVDA